MLRFAPVLLLATALMPSSAEALTFVQVLSLFHVAAGLLLTFTVLVFAAGVGTYLARLGTWPSYRETSIRVLEWAVGLLFILVVLIALVRYFQLYTTVMLSILAFIIIVVVAIFIVRAAAQKKESKPAPRGGGK